MGNVMQLQRNYGFAKDGPTATRLAMEAGLDQNMGGQYATFTKGLVLSGALSTATLDRAVGNVLRKKFASGLFDQPPTDPGAAAKNVNSPAHRALAREAARQGLVLLVNRRPPGNHSGPHLACFPAPALCQPHQHGLSGSHSSASRGLHSDGPGPGLHFAPLPPAKYGALAARAAEQAAPASVACPRVLGCRGDSARARVLPFKVGNSSSGALTLGTCAAACAGLGYDRAGAEFGHECWCGHSSMDPDGGYGSGGCTMPCSGDRAQTCGGNGALTELAIECKPAAPAPTPVAAPPLPARLRPRGGVAVIGELGGCGAGQGGSHSDCVARLGLLGGYTQYGARVVTIEDAFRARGYNVTFEGVNDHERCNMGTPTGGGQGFLLSLNE